MPFFQGSECGLGATEITFSYGVQRWRRHSLFGASFCLQLVWSTCDLLVYACTFPRPPQGCPCSTYGAGGTAESDCGGSSLVYHGGSPDVESPASAMEKCAGVFVSGEALCGCAATSFSARARADVAAGLALCCCSVSGRVRLAPRVAMR